MEAILQIVLLLLMSKNIFAEVNRAIPPGFDANAMEVTYSTYINGDLSVNGTIYPITSASIGNSKKRSFSFPAQTLIERVAANIDSKFPSVYATNDRPIATWAISKSTTTQKFINVSFGIPAEFDTTVSPTVDLLLGVKLNGNTSQVVNLAVDADYITSGSEMGTSKPATGIKQTATTGNLTIVEPTGTNNLRVYKISVSLNAALITAGCLCNLFFYRVAPTGSENNTEYNNDIYLIAANFNFSVT
jgi:hypothetical protein